MGCEEMKAVTINNTLDTLSLLSWEWGNGTSLGGEGGNDTVHWYTEGNDPRERENSCDTLKPPFYKAINIPIL